jgi:hypothetical protein
MFRAASLLVLSLASIATANGPPPWHSEQSWQAVFEFPTDDGVKWTVMYEVRKRQPGGGMPYWHRVGNNGLRTATLTSPGDFTSPGDIDRYGGRPPLRARVSGTSSNGEYRSVDVQLPSAVVHDFAARAVTFVRYRVEWGADGIELTLLEEDREYGPVVLAYILGTASVVYAVGLWLFVRRRNRLTRTGPPPGR